MIIKHIDGKVTDTDKLPDMDAAIIEKVEELRNLCSSANRVLYLVVDTTGHQKMTTFWNFKTDEAMDHEKTSLAFKASMVATHRFIQHITLDSMGIYPTAAVDNDKLENLSNGDGEEDQDEENE